MKHLYSKKFIFPLVCVFLFFVMPQPLQADVEDDIERIEKYQQISNILLTLAGILIVIGVVVSIVKSSKESAEARKKLEEERKKIKEEQKSKETVIDSLSQEQPEFILNQY